MVRMVEETIGVLAVIVTVFRMVGAAEEVNGVAVEAVVTIL